MEYTGKIHNLQWNQDMHYALGFSKLWCRAIGVWPWQRNEMASMVRFGVLFTVEVAAATSLVEVLFMYGNCGSLSDLIDGLSAMLTFVITALKVLLPWIQQGRMRYIMQSLMNDWANVGEPRNRRIMNQYAMLGRLAYIIQISGTFLGCLQLIVLRPPTFSTGSSPNASSLPRSLVMGPSCWAPHPMPMSLYLLHYYLTFLAIFGVVIIYPGCDSFMFSTVLHLCGQFDVLNATLDEVSDDYSDREQKRRIREYSIRHNRLLVLGHQLNHTVGLIILSELFSNGLLICISGIAIFSNIKKGNVNNDDINYGLRIYVWYCELFMYSYVGERLANQVDKLQNTVYNCPWYSMPVSIVKDIKFIMMSNNSFCYLTAGGIFVMNYETFKEITRLMFSCFSVLKLVLE